MRDKTVAPSGPQGTLEVHSRMERRRPENPFRWSRRFLERGGAILMTSAGLVAGIGGTWGLYLWNKSYRLSLMDTFLRTNWDASAKVLQDFSAVPNFEDSLTNVEESLSALNAAEPLLTQVIDLRDRQAWQRSGSSWKKIEVQPRWITWAEEAAKAGGGVYAPRPDSDPEMGRICTLVAMHGRWAFVRRWLPGSSEGDAQMRNTLGATPALRINLTYRANGMSSPPRQEDTPFQIGGSLATHRFSYTMMNDSLGPGWRVRFFPSERVEQEMSAKLRLHFLLTWGTGGVFAVLYFSGWWLRARARRQARQDAERLAALTHSLKTPLAVLRLRCDALRLGGVPVDEMDAELIRIGEEADQLAATIQEGLGGFRDSGLDRPEGVVDEAWIMEMASEISPALRSDHRELRVRCREGSGVAILSDLRVSLYTLLENALAHGGGAVSLETWVEHERFHIRIADEGTQPGVKRKSPGLGQGTGLGLYLLVQVARREGWGFSMRQMQNGGFEARLELRAAR